MTDRVITWNTHKTAAGYEWRVYAITYQQPSETLKTGVCSSRAIARHLAQQWVRCLKRAGLSQTSPLPGPASAE